VLYKDNNPKTPARHHLEETTDFIFIKEKGPPDLDIKEYKKNNANPLTVLQFSEKDTVDILNALPDLVLKIQRNGNIIYCNSHNKYLNLNRDEIIGKNISEVFHPLTHLQFAEAVERAQLNELTQIFEFQQFENSELREYETRLRKIDPQNEYVAVIRDISEQKRNELALKKNENKLRSLFESAAHAMVVLNAQGKIELANTACEKLFGYDKNELLGKVIEVLIPEEYCQKHDKNITNFFTKMDIEKTDCILETYGRTKDRNIFPVEIRISSTDFFEGNFLIASIIDLTHHKNPAAK
jgi:PAS domain S-box-containing protein